MKRSTHPLLRRVATLAVLAAGLLVGCQNKTSDRDITFVNYDDLLAMLTDTKQATVVVDVRNWESYDQSHIAGAICIPLPELRPNDPLIGSADRIVVYGESFDSPLSPAAAKRLIADGYANVFDFRGGLEYWIEQGGPIQTLEPVQAPGVEDEPAN